MDSGFLRELIWPTAARADGRSVMWPSCWSTCAEEVDGDVMSMAALRPSAVEARMDDDEYDPRSPENIAPASEEEVQRTSAELLARQIAKLEAHIARRRGEYPVVVHHYKSVVDELRSQATLGLSGCGLVRAKSFAYLYKEDDEPVASTTRLSHLRVRSTPTGFSPMEAGGKLSAEQAGRKTTLLGAIADEGTSAQGSPIDENPAAPPKTHDRAGREAGSTPAMVLLGRRPSVQALVATVHPTIVSIALLPLPDMNSIIEAAVEKEVPKRLLSLAPPEGDGHGEDEFVMDLAL